MTDVGSFGKLFDYQPRRWYTEPVEVGEIIIENYDKQILLNPVGGTLRLLSLSK